MHSLFIRADVTETVTAIIYIRVNNVTETERMASVSVCLEDSTTDIV